MTTTTVTVNVPGARLHAVQDGDPAHPPVLLLDAGIFDLVKGKIGGILAKVNEWAKNGKLKAWAEKVSVWLEKAFNWATNFIEQTDWAKVGDSIANVAKLVAAVANGLSNAYKWATLLGAVDAWSDRAFTGAAPGAAPGRANRDRQMTGGSAVSAEQTCAPISATWREGIAC